MKICFFSTSPHIGVGYGVMTRELVSRMKRDGHEVIVATKHHLGGHLIIEGIDCTDGTELEVINQMAVREKFDYIISMNDSWAFSAYNNAKGFIKDKWVMGVFLDTEWIHYHLLNIAKESKYQIAVTEHGKKELERVGFHPFYAPLGVDTNIFKPDLVLREQFRKKKGWEDDTFVIGFVGINYPTDRKNIIGLIKAFQRFHNRHQNSELYLHTDIIGSATSGNSLQWIMGSCGFDMEGKGAIKIVDQINYHLWNISRDELVGLYNAFDVFCFPTQGEGFGLPIVEAQSCGCPIIVTDTTSGKQLCKGGLLIYPTEDDYKYSTLKTWFVQVPPSAIDKRLETMYKIWEAKKLEKYQKKAREGMLEYNWDIVYDKYWRPLLKTLEDNLKPIAVKDMQPDWGYLHRQMIGRIMFKGKFNCDQFGCKEVCNWDFPKLGKEPDDDRVVMSRSYPIFPSKTGELMVDINCKLAKWLSPRFVEEVTILWEELWSYPKIREQILELWDNRYFSKGDFIPLKDISYDFDDTYANIMQNYFTTFKVPDKILDLVKISGNKILDVGCGKGDRVKELQEKGFDVLGTEINTHWINEKDIIKGDIYHLPFEDNSFDAVLNVDVLEHLKDPLPAIKELFRVSKKYVIVEITTTSDLSMLEDPTHYTRWSPPHWERELSEYGEIIERITGQAWLLEKNHG